LVSCSLTYSFGVVISRLIFNPVTLEKKIQSALISVYEKKGLDVIVSKLHELGVVMYSTGGTQAFIEGLGLPVVAVESLTGYPSIFGGRVKTLHPKIFGGILHRRDEKSDLEEASKFEIPPIDLVLVDLYPFEDTVASGASHDDIIEKIDIGGISLIRGAAKNYRDVLVIPSMAQYSMLEEVLNTGGKTTEEQRRYAAACAFDVSSHYDSMIYGYVAGEQKSSLKVSIQQSQSLRYGENPHQKGVFFGDLDKIFTKLNGKELSYNNLLDIDAAVNLISEFDDTSTTFAILKHNNACGIASRSTVKEAYEAALACDPTSAFGGILICNKGIDFAAAEKINELFCEVVIAPSFDDKSMELLRSKANRILLQINPTSLPSQQVRTLLNGVLMQDRDAAMETKSDLRLCTNKSASESQISDLLFANKLAKHTKSNTIVLVKNAQLCASGTGQTSRVDALRQAIEKAKAFGFSLEGAVMASDAFFPFPDCVEIAHNAGINAVVQPGGSIKDQLSIDYCNAHGIAMYLTGVRHFRH
jgi:phosphoribosylaminoimidazolecarboxamide formyltransferase/IMP cyclohydrolase